MDFSLAALGWRILVLRNTIDWHLKVLFWYRALVFRVIEYSFTLYITFLRRIWFFLSVLL